MKKIFPLILASLVVTTMSASAFTDVADPEVALSADTLESLGIIGGFPDGSFKPNDVLTRAQFAKMAVISLGDDDLVTLQQSFTVFPDVLSTHWAAGYVNVAVLDSQILSGYPDGTFAPDNSISEAEAVTICLRMLGYTVEDVGLFWPADYISKGAELGLTDGLVIDDNAPMTRGRAAILLTNLLTMEEKEGTLFANRVGASVTEGVTLLDTAESDLSLASGTLRVSSGDTVSVMYSDKDLPSSQVGRRGVLVNGVNGKVAGFVPYRYEEVTATVKSSDKDGITTLDGGRYLIPITTEVVGRGSIRAYQTAWQDLRPGVSFTMYYNDDGVLQYISTSSVISTDKVNVLSSNYSSSNNPLKEFYSDDIIRNATIIKNGVTVSAAALREYDTVSYNSGTRTITATDSKLTGTLEAVYPTKTSAQQITVYGVDFRLIDGYTPDLSMYEDTDNVTVILTSDGRVAEVLSAKEESADMYGELLSYSGGTATVELANGLVISGNADSDTAEIVGNFVTVKASGLGRMSISAPDMRSTLSMDFDMSRMTLGGTPVSPVAVFYERANVKSPVVKTDLAALGGASSLIDGDMIYHYEQDSAGQIIAMVLGNVSGDAYTYGRMWAVETDNADGNMISRSIDLTYNGGDEYSTVNGVDDGFFSVIGPFVGMAFQNGEVTAAIKLINAGTVNLSSFDGGDYVTVEGERYEIAEDVYVELEDGGTMSLEELKNVATSFKIHTDRSLEDGGKVRVIVGVE